MLWGRINISAISNIIWSSKDYFIYMDLLLSSLLNDESSIFGYIFDTLEKFPTQKCSYQSQIDREWWIHILTRKFHVWWLSIFSYISISTEILSHVRNYRILCSRSHHLLSANENRTEHGLSVQSSYEGKESNNFSSESNRRSSRLLLILSRANISWNFIMFGQK